MELFLAGDTDIRSGISKILSELRCKEHDFDSCLANVEESEISKIGIILICTSFINTKPRVRFSNKEKCLDFDIIFNLEQDLKETIEERRKKVANAIINDTEKYLMKYKKTRLKDVDINRIIVNLKKYFKNLNW